MKLPATRVKSIDEESDAMGWIHIGLEHRAQGDLPRALKAFQKALTLGTDNELAQQRLDETQAMLTEEKRMSRKEAVSNIDTLISGARTAIDNKEFETAEKNIDEANGLVPSDKQKSELKKLVSNLYMSWAEDRADKLDPVGQEEMLNRALAADPNNTAIIDRMLALWEDDPDKKQQVANVYEVMLDRNPGDKLLRSKLAELYDELGDVENMVRQSLIIYKDDIEAQRGSQLEDRLLVNVAKLHRKFAGEGRYDEAIHFAKIELTINPDANPSDLIYYTYLDALAKTDLSDVGARLKLAQMAEQQGLDPEALEHYRWVLSQDPENAEAAEGVMRFANRLLNQAKMLFDDHQWEMAKAYAERVQKEYPMANLACETAARISGKASIEIQRDRREKKERAKELVEQANSFYETAEKNFNHLFDEDRTNIPGLSSSRQEAKRYYQLAIDAYEQVIQLDSSYSDSTSIVSVRLGECRSRLKSLNQGARHINYSRQSD